MVISVWGVVFLGLLGVFFYVQSVTLFPDLHFPEEDMAGAKPLSVPYVFVLISLSFILSLIALIHYHLVHLNPSFFFWRGKENAYRCSLPSLHHCY